MIGSAQREAPVLMELKHRPIWVCWKYVPDKSGKPRKVPMSAKGGGSGTNELYRHTWVCYDEAEAARKQKGFSGVGFVIPEGYFFLDIDHRDLADPLVVELLNCFSTYAERSVSGEGLHLYGKCDFSAIPTFISKEGERKLNAEFYTKNPHNGLEIYIGGLTNRFAAFTGDTINTEDFCECTSAVLKTLEEKMRRPISSQPSTTVVESQDSASESDWAVICYLREQKNGEKFSILFDDGAWERLGFQSQSEADASLCSLIAFRTGPDPEAIDRIFRQSKLYREKWERDDYREGTISGAIKACGGVFHRSKMPLPEFIRLKGGNGAPQLIPTLLAKTIRETTPYVLVRDSGKQGTLTYVYRDGVYKLYSRDMMMGLIKSPVEAYNEELVSMGKISETYNLLMTDLNYISQEDLNADEHIINFQNGLLKVSASSLELLPHNHEVLSTIQIPCRWVNHGEATPAFDRYISTLTNGDRQLAKLLLEFIGVAVSNVKGWRTKKALFLVGQGDTGKSVLKSLVERMLGKGNFIGIDLQEIEARFGTGSMYGTRLAGSSDMSFLSVNELKTFKKITGGDSLFAEFKGQQGFEYTYGGLLWFCMNRLPKFGGDDGQWVYDRIMVVPCVNVIPKEKQDKELLDKLYAEREGIIHKAVKALQNVISNGYRFDEPACVVEARKDYMRENNSVIEFYEECMCLRPAGKITDDCTTGKVDRVYQAWYYDNYNNRYSKNMKDFKATLALHLGCSVKDLVTRGTGKGSFYRTVTLTDEAKELYKNVYSDL